MTVDVWTDIDRPVSAIFEIFVANHVENHLRWDPDIEFRTETDGPMGVGTIIRRSPVCRPRSTPGTGDA